MAHFENGVSVLGRILEQGINFRGNYFLEWGANLESWAAHTHPKNTQEKELINLPWERICQFS